MSCLTPWLTRQIVCDRVCNVDQVFRLQDVRVQVRQPLLVQRVENVESLKMDNNKLTCFNDDIFFLLQCNMVYLTRN
jgi:hypothetical protein